MEIHSVLPEERARDEQGKTLPWGYRYLDSSRNLRTAPEETGSFGRHRDARYTGSKGPSRGRTGTTPVRKEDPTVAEFGRLLGMQQQQEDAQRSKDSTSPPSGTRPNISEPTIKKEKVATEVILFGYASKDSEWRVIRKYERIVAPQGFICEDYDRTDPNQPLTSTFHFPSLNTPIRGSLTKDALKKSRKYRGGAHWIKVTFDSYESAERAVFYSPQDIENHLVFAQMFSGQGPFSDVAIPKASQLATDLQRQFNSRLRTLTTADSNGYLSAAAAEAHNGAQTLPRSFTSPDTQYSQPQDDSSISTSTTASSATATNYPALTSASTTSLAPPSSAAASSSLRSRSTPDLLISTTTTTSTSTTPTPNPPPSTSLTPRTASRLSQHPSVRRAVLRPISEALPPQPSITERILRNIPIVSWFVGPAAKSGGGGVGEDVLTNEKGEFDWERNGLYWRIWGMVDWVLGTDSCGLRAE